MEHVVRRTIRFGVCWVERSKVYKHYGFCDTETEGRGTRGEEEGELRRASPGREAWGDEERGSRNIHEGLD